MSSIDGFCSLVSWEMPSRLNPSPEVLSLAKILKIPYQIVQILEQRGLNTLDAIKDFLDPLQGKEHSPWVMKDIDKGVERLKRALNSNEKIVVHGDYDVDGQTGTALLVTALRGLGANVDYYIPLRLEEGYGLSTESVTNLAKEHDLLITVDCGITSIEEVKLSKRFGMDCIITDHHEPDTSLPEDACAIINPKRKDCSYPFKELAGCGVAYKFIQGLYSSLGKDPCEVERWLDLVSIGTIVDVVPLVDENRRYVARGLPMVHQRVGLHYLMEISGIKGQTPSSSQIGFMLGPRLNAAGRMADAKVGVELLITESKEKAKQLVVALDEENAKRHQIEDQIMQQACKWIDENVDLSAQRAIVVSGKGWHLGVIGIVASRLVGKYKRPAVCLSEQDDQITGSARSVHSFDIYQALASLSHLFTRFGGHKMAAGLSLSKENLSRFTEEFVLLCNKQLHLLDLVPKQRADCVVTLEEVDLDLARAVARLGPFGVGNPEPVFAVMNVQLIESKKVGESQNHWSFKLQSKESKVILNGIGFNAGQFASTFRTGDRVDILGSLTADIWQGIPRLQLRLIDVRAALPQQVTQAVHSVNVAINQSAAGLDNAHPDDKRYVDSPSKNTGVNLHLHNTSDLLLDGNRTILLWVRKQLVLVSRGLPPTTDVDLLFWDWPISLENLQDVVRKVKNLTELVNVHLLSNSEALKRAERALEADYPSIDTLRKIYVVLRRESTRQMISLDKIKRILMQNECIITDAGLFYGLEIFSQVKLVEYKEVNGELTQLHVLPTNGEKVDLKSAVRYNEGEAIKRGFTSFIRQINTDDGRDHIVNLLNQLL